MENLPTRNAWYCHNGERRAKGLPNLTWEEYLAYRRDHELDTKDRLKPKKTTSILKMVAAFGKSIFSKKKVCSDCGEEKLLKEFTFTPERRGKPWIEAWCRDCNQKRRES